MSIYLLIVYFAKINYYKKFHLLLHKGILDNIWLKSGQKVYVILKARNIKG